MWKQFSEDFQQIYKSRQKDVKLISNLIDSNSDMIIYGNSGSGKTTLIRDLFFEKKINYVKINCIQCQTKQTLIQALISSLEKKFNYKLKSTTKTSHLIHRINQLHEYTQIQLLDESKDNYFSFQDHQFYLLLDNIEKLSVSPKFFSQLINIKNILKINFSIIFCGISFLDEVMLENGDLDLLPSIMIPPMNDEDLKCIIAKQLNIKVLEQDKKCLQVFGAKFIQNIVSNFILFTRNATTLSSISLRLFKVLIYNFQNKDNPQVKDYSNLIKDDKYQKAQRQMCDDPYLNDGDTKDFIKKIMNKTTETLNPIIISKLPFYTSIILIACWIGNRNPESTDKKLFKDYKGKQYKGKQESVQQYLKPVKIDRMIALAQSLISNSGYLSSYNNINGKDNLSEMNGYDQSIDFYSQIASLVEMKYINIESNENSLSKTQYLSTIDEQFIQSICNQYKIDLSLILYRKE